MPTKNIHVGDQSIQATGNVEVSSSGGRTAVGANGADGNLMLSATSLACLQSGSGLLCLENAAPSAGKVALQTGPDGSIAIGLGPTELGARMKLKAGEIEIAVGPPDAGASIKMTASSILLNVAGNTFELTPSGLTETITEVTTRSATSSGHELKCAESSYKLAAAGETLSASTSSIKPMTNGESKAGAMSTSEGAAQSVLKGAVVMIN